MTDKRDEALKLALEALEEGQPDDPYPHSLQSKAITAIRKALAEHIVDANKMVEQPAQQQEPVAWYDEEYDCAYTAAELDGGNVDGLLPLYTSPPASKPLTDEQIGMAFRKAFPVGGVVFTNGAIDFARAIEAAHGIKGGA